MKRALKVVAVVVGLIVIAAGGGFAWAKTSTAAKLERTIRVHSVDFPIPFPLSSQELAELRRQKLAERVAAAAEAAGAEPEDEMALAPEPTDLLAAVDLKALALERALSRGQHLVEARYSCIECHGRDFGGGTMIDDPAIGRILGPNITTGKGGKGAALAPADWDHIVRHGVRRDGRPSVMPSQDFARMSDQELSDIVVYIRSRPPVDREVEPVTLGPLGTFLIAIGELPLSVDVISTHGAKHPEHPPDAQDELAFGRHLAMACTGCHRASLEGGPVPGGAPDWPPAANITPHAQGLAGWAYDDFVAALRQGVRPDGTALRPPMAQFTAYAQKMTDQELAALWRYLQTVPPLPDGN